MAIPLRFRLLVHKEQGLKDASKILNAEMRGALSGIGKGLTRSAQSRMRENTGQEKGSLRTEVKGRNLGLRLETYSVLVQAFVDAYGREPGRMPPYKKGSRLFRWVKSKQFEDTTPVAKGERKLSHLSRRPSKVKRVPRVKKSSKITKRVATSARDKQMERVAFLVARKIFERGIKATHWNKKALEANKSNIVRQVKNAMERAALKISRG